VEPPYSTLGQRVYCGRHFAEVNKPHPGFWRASAVQIIGMALFSALVAGLASFVGPLSGWGLIVVGVLMALVPSLLWLVFFYQQDRLEPEPKTKIAAVALLALLLTQAVGLPVINDLFQLDAWAGLNRTVALLASILIIGFTLQAIVYVAVRMVVYTTPEFDERMDGIVYGTVAGLGTAALLNLRYVLDNGGVALSYGVIQVVTVALAQASFGGLLGYFMAEARFTHRPIWWIPAGLTLSAVLNGLFRWLNVEVSVSGLSVNPWRSLLLGMVVALLAFGLLVFLMRRTTEVTRVRG
jgi:RsiW-degrading membrane proteinase PrsW (M82 family)